MLGMFSFINDLGNYEDRKVGRDDFNWGFVSTCSVSDGRKPYETGIRHKDYNGDRLVVVECYDSKAKAAIGHKRWVKTMTSKKLPATLKDCANAQVSQMCEVAGVQMKFKRGEKPKRLARSGR
jgi:hypothetical protein